MVTAIKDFMSRIADNNDVKIYNRDVKIFLLEHYGDMVQFCPSNRVSETGMCFSSDISVDNIAATMRNTNVVRSCGELLKESVQKADFKLANKFCDDRDLQESWETTKMPDELLTFFASLFGINRSHLLNVEMIDSTTDYDDVTH